MPSKGNTSASGLAPVGHEALHDRVYREVKEAIMSGSIRPGATITIRTLAARLGTSPMPVREALRRPVAERALEMLPNRSVTLPAMTPDRFDEICRIRIAIEGEVAEVAATRMPKADLACMRRLNEAMFRPEHRHSPRYLLSNRAFHFTLYRAAGMPLATAMIESLWVQSGPFLNHVMTDDAEQLGSDHHGAVLRALARRDGGGVRAAITGDISDAGAIIRALLTRDRERASV